MERARDNEGRFAASAGDVAYLAQTHDGYYVLTRPDDSRIGGTSRSSLGRYARREGWRVQYRDERPAGISTGAWRP